MYAKKMISFLLSAVTALSAMTPVSAKNAPESGFDQPAVNVTASRIEKTEKAQKADAPQAEAMFSVYMAYYTDDDEIITIVEDNELITPVEGLSWNASTKTLTMNGFDLSNGDMYITSGDEYGTINIVSNRVNTLCVLTCDAAVRLSGNGFLNLGSFEVFDLEMVSGTLNIESKYLAPIIEYGGDTWTPDMQTGYGIISMEYGEVDTPCLYRFKDATVNVSGGYNAGITQLSGNIEIINSNINIDIPRWGEFGLTCGWTDGNNYWGGDLTVQNSTVEITVSEDEGTLTYFYKFIDPDNNMKFYAGRNKAEERLTFDDAFVLLRAGGIARYSRNCEDFPGSTYLMMTSAHYFGDVLDNTRYYYDPVYWAYYHEPVQITTGTSPVLFSPDANVTRGQMVTFLYRLAGQPAAGSSRKFDDVDPSRYYANAIAWAASKGITTGYYGTNNFGPDDFCTREQIVTFLWRYANSPKPEKITSFTDTKDGAYYLDALSWAAEKGITVGLNDGTGRFGVGHNCTRAMCVTFLFRYAMNVH